MRTSTILMICLFLDIGMTQLSAQTQSVATKETSETDFWETVINCDGETDVLIGSYSMTYIWHYNNGNFIWGRSSLKVEATSENTGEIFTGHANYTHTEVTGLVTWHFNFNGNMGTHYLESFTWNSITDPDMEHIVVDKVVCIEKGKE